MVNSYNFSLTRTGPKNRFKYQAVVFENDKDLENLFCKVLPRIPSKCRYLLTKRADENTDKPEEFRVNISRIEEIIKF